MTWAVSGLTTVVARLKRSPELVAKRHAQPLEAEGIRALEKMNDGGETAIVDA